MRDRVITSGDESMPTKQDIIELAAMVRTGGPYLRSNLQAWLRDYAPWASQALDEGEE